MLSPKRIGRSAALPLLFLATSACSGAGASPSVCDGLAEETLGITRQVYSPCAGEILATLDSLERPLARFVLRSDEEARVEAESYHRRLRYLMKEAGFTADVWREAREGAGRTVERWPDSDTRAFNIHVGTASAQYLSALRYPNTDNLKQGQREHAAARQSYARFR